MPGAPGTCRARTGQTYPQSPYCLSSATRLCSRFPLKGRWPLATAMGPQVVFSTPAGKSTISEAVMWAANRPTDLWVYAAALAMRLNYGGREAGCVSCG